jgi:hypothetical protein
MNLSDYINFLNEAKKPAKSTVNIADGIPTVLFDEIKKAGKEKEFNSFIENLPSGDTTSQMLSMFNEIAGNKSYTNEFVSNLWSLKSPEDISSSKYSSGLGQRIFATEPKGVGRGELFLAWLIKGSAVSGGSESFDLAIANLGKFEVKDYRSKESPNAGIRLGTKGKVTQFDFWKEFIDTIRRIDKLTGRSAGATKFSLEDHFTDAKFIESANYLLDNQSKILGGELGKEGLDMFKQFYTAASSVEIKTDGYTQVILRGPNAKPIELSINPLSIVQVSQKSFEIIPSNQVDTYTYVMTEIRRLKYVRDPKTLDTDLQSAVDSIVGDIPFIIFRNDGIEIAKKGDFIFDSISQGGIKIVETWVAKNRKVR